MNRHLTSLQCISPALIAGLILLGLVPLFWFAFRVGGIESISIDRSVLNVLLFTLKQALLSTLLSVVLAIPVARALARRQFWGRRFVLNIFAVPLALPAIVAVLGTAAVYGNTGWLSGWFNIYGLPGILLVHVFFNLPLAVRLFLEGLETIAPESFRLAAQLSFSDWATFKNVEWPVLGSALPRVGGLIFLLCAASFVVVLTLGGPSATTLEVAIYYALRMDFDVGRAISLALVQIILCAFLVALVGKLFLQPNEQFNGRHQIFRKDGRNVIARLFDGVAVLFAMAIVLPPIAAVVYFGAANMDFNAALLRASGFSFLIGTLSACCAVALAWQLARRDNSRAQVLALAGLIVPPAVLATGWFLALRKFDNSLLVTLLAVVALNTLMALPFCVAVLREGFRRLGISHERLCQQLGLTGFNKFWRIDIPFMKPALATALLLAFVLSLGDLTAVTLLGSQGLTTLPALIHEQMGNYRGQAASGTALILAAVCFGLAGLAQRMGRVQ